MAPRLTVTIESWPVAGSFTISRGSVSEVVVVVATIEDGGHVGRGECRPYPRYGETPEGVKSAIEAHAPAIAGGLTRNDLQMLLPAGAARNALDAALWDLHAKKTGTPAWRTAGLDGLKPLTTVYTISLDSAEKMAEAAARAAHRPLLKIKLGGPEGDIERLEAIRAAAPHTRLVVDANEGWHHGQLADCLDAARRLDVEMVEQPLPAGEDAMLSDIAHPVPICADESAHDLATLEHLIGRYDIANIKLDKTGGLTEALAMKAAARHAGLKIFVGCMLSTSLSMAPAFLAAQDADYVDLDGPLLLARDRDPGLVFDGSVIAPPSPALWG
ncbi:MAG: N-acetyl-D-Glu racemase DgcA [Flavobacteriaceae bacterium]